MYGAVLVSPLNLKDETDKPVVIGSRIGSLFFVKVNGEMKEVGVLESFKLDDGSFIIDFRNSGNIHLNPYGVIKVYDIFGRQIDQMEIDPYYALPGALRNRKIDWQDFVDLAVGRYKAELSLNRGYKDIIDQAEIVFWINPTLIIIVGAIAGLLLAFFIWMIISFIKKKDI